ncbi:hypothetical protein [Lacrimispora indolis]|uniref:hypothetical protein n=1 Tax=Lacrimispora indolis TaxID=69825 RepID=UPI00041AA273|nr:hypothetical protein [[Clostridium] methoxybenzovorans]
MKMSKVLAIMLAASMTFSLAACGGGAVSNSGGTALQAQNSDASSSGNSSADGSSTDSGGERYSHCSLCRRAGLFLPIPQFIEDKYG